MQIVIRHTEGCPHVDMVESRTRQAVVRLGIEAEIESALVRTVADAEEMRFVGSPTILIDGKDPFADNDTPALACRIYATESGLEGAPSVEQIVTVLDRAKR